MTSPASKPVFRTLAAVAALSLTGAALAAPAHAAEKTNKVVRLSAAQYPKLIDNPGSTDDKVRVVNLPGVVWKIDGKDVAFPSGKSVADTTVTAESTVTATAVTDDEQYNYTLQGVPSSWTFDAPSADTPKVDGTAVTAFFSDMPGAAKDTVTLTKVAGIKWTLTTGDTPAVETVYGYDAFGAKDTLVVPAKSGWTLKAELTGGAELVDAAKPVPQFTNSLTDADTVAYTADVLNAAVDLGDNPFDAHKGYGKGAAQETVRIAGIPGVKWKVGDATRSVAVKGVAYIPVSADYLEENGGKVTVKAEATGSYSVPADWSGKEVDFSDGSAPISRAIANDVASKSDLAGATQDTLTIPAQRNVTWWVGQEDARTKKYVYKAQKPNKAGNVVYKVRHVRGATSTIVKIKPVADRGYVLAASTGLVTDFAFETKSVDVPVANQGVVEAAQVTLNAHEGVTSWTVSEKVGTKTVRTTVTTKTMDAIGAKSIVIPTATQATVAVRYVRNYVPATA